LISIRGKWFVVANTGFGLVAEKHIFTFSISLSPLPHKDSLDPLHPAVAGSRANLDKLFLFVVLIWVYSPTTLYGKRIRESKQPSHLAIDMGRGGQGGAGGGRD
jgi:hypothetical protein